jgi:quercetin dioxygenase-like cupin family protein
MKSKWVCAVLVAVLGTGVYARSVLATPPSGVTTTTLGVARFGDIDATTKTKIGPAHPRAVWKGRIKTRGASDLYVIQNTISPGGTFGWHSHPGPSLVIVKSGTATFYMSDDPTCSPVVVQAGQGFVDNGHDTHVVRNEGNVDLVTVVTSLVPAGFERRIDEPAPANCPNLQHG